MSIQRKEPRYSTLAHARIPGLFQGEALLKNLSVTGCCIEYTEFVNVKPGIPYTVEIFPERAAKIGRFDLTVESRWVRSESYACELGFLVTASPKGRLFQRYVDYLAWRSAAEHTGSTAVQRDE
jgi:hypothetical protein